MQEVASNAQEVQEVASNAQVQEVASNAQVQEVASNAQVQEKQYIQTGDMIKNTKRSVSYFLREGKCFTCNKLIGKWNSREEQVEFYNLGEDEVKQITFSKVTIDDCEKELKCFIDADCVVYIDADGDIWGKYYPAENKVVVKIVDSQDSQENSEEYEE